MKTIGNVASVLALLSFGWGCGVWTHKILNSPPAKEIVISIEDDTKKSLDFATSIGQAIKDRPTVQPAAAKKVLAILNGPNSVRKTVLLRYMERHARAQLMEGHLATGSTEAIDWSKVNWDEVLGVVLKILLLILPLL